MSVIINASSTSGLVISNDMSGQLQFQNNGVNLPMSGLAPAFSAYPSATQTITASTFTKLQANIEEFDTNSNYDTTNYRFTPTVAGYYQFTGGCTFSTTQTAELLITLYKNGARFRTIFDMEATSWTGLGTVLVYANGTTDYFELYIYTASTGTKVTAANARDSYFSACLLRGA